MNTDAPANVVTPANSEVTTTDALGGAAFCVGIGILLGGVLAAITTGVPMVLGVVVIAFALGVRCGQQP